MIGRETPLKRAEDAGRLMAPHALLFLLLLLSVAALPLPSWAGVKPNFLLMAVYYWAIYRPTLLPPMLCFLMGVVVDSLSGMPVGINAFVLVVAQWIVRDQRRFLMGQPYGTIWAVFGLVSAVAAAVQWGLYGLAHMNWGPPLPVLSGTLLGVFLFPPVSLLLVCAHRMLPVASRP